MRRLLAIADDFSGAAEIAGIGWRYGLAASVTRRQPSGTPEDGLTVIDTDSRSLSPAARAARRVTEFVSAIDPRQFDLIYKKTDSAMRGPLIAEVEALMAAFDRPAALIVAQNPSRGRTVADGEYRINGIPLHATAFARDPEHPAQTSDVLQMLAASSSPSQELRSVRQGESLPGTGVTVGEACDEADVRHWAGQAADHVLLAGGADFFQSILAQSGLTATRPSLRALPHSTGAASLFVCGSALAYSRPRVAEMSRKGVPVCLMPDQLAADPKAEKQSDQWADAILGALERNSRALMTIGRHIEGGAVVARQLESAIAETIARVVARRPSPYLLLEGGATAAAVCRRLAWHDFTVTGEFACGVVLLQPQAARDATTVTAGIVVKPGSYSWPTAVWGLSDI